MNDFSNKTYAAILAAMLQRIPDTFDKRDTSPIPTALGPAAYTLEEFYLSLNQVQKSAFVQTAVGTDLDRLSILGSISRYPASAAVRLGVFNAPVPIGARFSTINGTDSINFVVTAATGQDGQYQLRAETTGDIGNTYAGPLLPITSIPGLTSAQLTELLIPGDDEETDEELRARLIEALNERPFGGNMASYRSEILSMDGVGAIQVWPVWDGGGTVKCSLLGADFLPASAELVDMVQQAVDPLPNQGLGLGMAPIGAQVKIAAPEAVTVDVTGSVVLAAGYTIAQVQPVVEAAIAEYLLEVRKAWDKRLGNFTVTYAANVYLARILALIVNTPGIVNAIGISLNGAAVDLMLTESGQLQQVPVLGTVILHE